jgi:hypothetical protein
MPGNFGLMRGICLFVNKLLGFSHRTYINYELQITNYELVTPQQRSLPGTASRVSLTPLAILEVKNKHSPKSNACISVNTQRRQAGLNRFRLQRWQHKFKDARWAMV